MPLAVPLGPRVVPCCLLLVVPCCSAFAVRFCVWRSPCVHRAAVVLCASVLSAARPPSVLSASRPRRFPSSISCPRRFPSPAIPFLGIWRLTVIGAAALSECATPPTAPRRQKGAESCVFVVYNSWRLGAFVRLPGQAAVGCGRNATARTCGGLLKRRKLHATRHTPHAECRVSNLASLRCGYWLVFEVAF